MNYFASNACPSMNTGMFEQQFPVGMGYIPWQIWRQTYPLDKALNQGTIFPELDLDFNYRRYQK
ncbi:MAG: spore coat associated protein CotJA [Lachnospiraceae bacterium]|nr:spore coat associated protein CotJA [Lachnospiraceae bacterium]